MTQPEPEPDLWQASWGGLSEQEGAPGPSGRPSVPDRYEWRDELGRGGMGAVHAVFDTVLGREVALKLVGSIQGSEGQRALREARLTAGLEHPSIVSIYDAGETPEGVGYYTMPVLRGRSLAAVLATKGTADVARGYAPIRMLLAVCEAIAYAHERSIVHRDIKPANIMVGEFGETQVLDWGLAAEVGDRAAPARVGTRGYSSPEQLEGSVPDPAADVYALGMVLSKIIRRLDAPPEDLQAIAESCCAGDVGKRYPDAGALARDLQRFLDGALVSARTYSSWALASRFFRTYWKAVAAGLCVIVALAAAGVGSYSRIDAAREDALSAERLTQRALDEQTLAFAWALESHALLELERGAFAEAEVLALQALERSESPRARGILMRTHAGPRPRAVRADVDRSCRTLDFDLEGEACVTEQGVTYYEDGAARWSVEGEIVAAGLGRSWLAIIEPGAVTFVDRLSGESLQSVPDTDRFKRFVYNEQGEVAAILGAGLFVMHEGEVRRLGSCGGDTLALAYGHGRVASLCRGGRLRIRTLGDEPIMDSIVPTDQLEGSIFCLGFLQDAEFLVGTVAGEVARYDAESGTLAGPWKASNRAVWQVEPLVGRQALVTADGGASASVVDIDSGVVRFSLPRGVRGIRARDGEIFAWAEGRRLRWSAPESGRPATFRSPVGLSSAAFDPLGSSVALARGDGTVALHEVDTGALVAEVPVARGVVKRVVFDAAGDAFAAVADVTGGYLIDRARPEGPISFELGVGTPLRRAVVATDDRERILAAPYRRGLLLIDGHGETTPVDGPVFVDLASSPSAARTVGLARDGTAYAVGESLDELGSLPLAQTIAVDDHAGIALASPAELALLEQGERLHRVSIEHDIEDLAFSPDGEFLAGASVEGELFVWNRSLEVVAQLAEAQDRVTWVGFAPDGRLGAAGWDGVLRMYELDVVPRPIEQLKDDASDAWGVELRDVLDGDN